MTPGGGALHLPYENASVVTTETHRVRERDVHLRVSGLVGNVVEIAGRVWMDVVHRRRQDSVADGEDAHHRLDRTGRAEAVAGYRLSGGHRELVRVIAEDVLDRFRLGSVAERRRRPVRVDVADV